MGSKVSMFASAVERVFAYWIDKFLIYSLLLGIGWIAGWNGFEDLNKSLESLMAASTFNINLTSIRGIAQYFVDHPEMLSFFQLISTAGLIYLVYSVVMEASKFRATIGKFIVGIHVDKSDTENANIPRLIGRNVLKKFIGALSIAFAFFHPERKSLHDIITGTRVVQD